MRAASLIIICSGQGHLAESGALDRAIDIARASKKDPVLVLGPDGDLFLEHTKQVDACEMVFDPNFKGEFFSSVKAGAQMTSSAAIIISLSDLEPDPVLWRQMEVAVFGPEAARGIDVLHSVTRDGVSQSATHTYLATFSGISKLREIPADADWLNQSELTVRNHNDPRSRPSPSV